MKQKLITEVMQQMLPYLDNAQLKQMRQVMEQTLFYYEVIGVQVKPEVDDSPESGCFMNRIVFNDYGHKVEIDTHIIDRIFQCRQTRKRDKEAGGVLIGRELESTGNLIIEKMTEPKSLDKQSRGGFERKDPAHIKEFEELHVMSGKTYGYFGEWHTHPEKVPNFSETDKWNWLKLYNDLPQKHVLYFIIAGINSIGVWKLDLSMSKLPMKTFCSDWDKL